MPALKNQTHLYPKANSQGAIQCLLIKAGIVASLHVCMAATCSKMKKCLRIIYHLSTEIWVDVDSTAQMWIFTLTMPDHFA